MVLQNQDIKNNRKHGRGEKIRTLDYLILNLIIFIPRREIKYNFYYHELWGMLIVNYLNILIPFLFNKLFFYTMSVTSPLVNVHNWLNEIPKTTNGWPAAA